MYKFKVIPTIALLVETDLDALDMGYRRLDSFNSYINANEYRIAVKVGYHGQHTYTLYTELPASYHFILQNADGSWSEKYKGLPSGELFSPLENPSEIMWFSIKVSPNRMVDVYNKKVIYFAITP